MNQIFYCKTFSQNNLNHVELLKIIQSEIEQYLQRLFTDLSNLVYQQLQSQLQRIELNENSLQKITQRIQQLQPFFTTNYSLSQSLSSQQNILNQFNVKLVDSAVTALSALLEEFKQKEKIDKFCVSCSKKMGKSNIIQLKKELDENKKSMKSKSIKNIINRKYIKQSDKNWNYFGLQNTNIIKSQQQITANILIEKPDKIIKAQSNQNKIISQSDYESSFIKIVQNQYYPNQSNLMSKKSLRKINNGEQIEFSYKNTSDSQALEGMRSIKEIQIEKILDQQSEEQIVKKKDKYSIADFNSKVKDINAVRQKNLIEKNRSTLGQFPNNNHPKAKFLRRTSNEEKLKMKFKTKTKQS